MLRVGFGLVLCALILGCDSSNSSVEHSPRAAVDAVPNTATRTLQFAGYTWSVKAASEGAVGPGPNYFADGPDNVWVDAAGHLHLRITYRDRRWWAAEVISARSFGYGTYRFAVDTPVETLDPNVVLGLFTWSDNPAFHHREIDIELSRWGQENNENAQCVLQPYDQSGNLVRFDVPPGLFATVHSFTWAPDRVLCQVYVGGEPRQGQASPLLFEHTFTRNIPAPGGENARMNLWLLGGQAPRFGHDIEVVIRRFEYLP